MIYIANRLFIIYLKPSSVFVPSIIRNVHNFIKFLKVLSKRSLDDLNKLKCNFFHILNIKCLNN